MTRGVSQPVAVWRFYAVIALLCSLLALLVGTLLSLQVLDIDRGYRFLQDQGVMRSVRTAEIPASRGMISDRRGEPLAVSTPVVSLWADPQILKGSKRLSELAGALGMKLQTLEDKLLRYKNKQFMYLQRHSMPAQARKVLDRQIEGVYGKREYRRFYPAGEVAAHLVGVTNVDDKGITGLELAYDDWLRGTPGKKKVIKDLHGEVVRDIGIIQAARPGKDLSLSIDLRLQYLQHRELHRAMTITGAVSGSIVTLNSKTGEVLGMVNYPAYNPNSRNKRSLGAMRNRAMIDVYEPGSTLKPLTVVAALESGRFSTETIIDTAPGSILVGKKLLTDPRDYGAISVSRIVEKSSQVGITKIALDLGVDPIRQVFDRFGLGRLAGTGFPGESGGLLPNHRSWSPIEYVNLAFGYGLNATPLQVARAYTAFANAGVLMQVSLLALEQEKPDGIRVIDPDIARQMIRVLEAVTQEHGTAQKARVPGYDVAGKTGTVYKVGTAGYSTDRYVALFAGIAPVNDPQIVTVVVINEPKGKAHGGGSAAAPVFSRVAEGALRLLRVPSAKAESVVAAPESRPRGAA
ncbi:MAG: penicillin-binding protein 2 [Halieaceae bacterium]|nr:penicillin-binding protein 2 [Halieaceae bacterium]